MVGDADCNNVVNAIDAALVLQFDAGILTGFPLCAGPDANLDTLVNAIDAALILQYSAGLIGALPPP